MPDIETHLIIVDTKCNEPVQMLTVTMIPDLEGVKKAPRETRFLHPRNDFSGIVVLSDLEGAAFNVLELSRGKIVERLGIYSNIAQLEYRENYTILYPRTGLKTHATRLSAGAESANCPDCEAGLCFVHWFVQTDKAIIIGKKPTPPTDPGYLCPSCGSSTCYGECEEEIFGSPPGGNVGGGSTGTPSNTETQTDSPSVQRAKTLFRNSHMIDENWEIVGDMLDEMDDTELGANLINSLMLLLKGKSIILEFDLNAGSAGVFDYSETKDYTKIVLKFPPSDDVLFEEIFHAYQAYHCADIEEWNNKMMNIEIEAGYARYLYWGAKNDPSDSGLANFYQNNQQGMAISGLSKFLDNNGHLKQGVTEDKLQNYLSNNLNPAYVNAGYYANKYPFNNTIHGTANFSNLQRLSNL